MMEREDVKEVFKVIKSVYHHFEVTSEKLDIWHRLMKDQNPEQVMRATERYIMTNKFPPSIADLIPENRNKYESDSIPAPDEFFD